jgi:hypothetical protein
MDGSNAEGPAVFNPIALTVTHASSPVYFLSKGVRDQELMQT